MKKQNYIQPSIEVLTVNATYNLCAESKFGGFSIGGGTETIDPSMGG